MKKATKNQLLRILRIQEIDLFFTEKGFSREYIHKRIIYPTWFITSRTYTRYLTINAKKQLRDTYDCDWDAELKKHRPSNYIQIMETLGNIDLLEVPDYLVMLQEGARR